MDVQKEHNLNGYPTVISYECTKKIIEQMDKNICRIKIGNIQGTGFFCKIPFPDNNNMILVFITNNHIINEDILNNNNKNIIIQIKEEKKERILNIKNRMIYTNEEYDVTIIEIKEIDNINYNLELDDIIINDILYNNNENDLYKYKTIYIIQYPESELSVSYGIIDEIYLDKEYNFNHLCSTRNGSSGSPILNKNNKLIGIHKEGKNKNNYNIGTFLNYPIKEFIKQNYNIKNNNIIDKI